MRDRAPPRIASPRTPGGNWRPSARLLHWVIAALVFAQIGLGLSIGMLDMYDPADVAWYKAWVPRHKSLGLTILLLMMLRLGVRARGPVPPLPAATPRWQARAARITHLGLYGLLILQPVLGYVQSAAYGATTRYFDLFVVPNVLPVAWQRPHTDVLRLAAQNAHKVIAVLIVVLVLLHLLGALKHHFVDRDDVLRRMLTGAARQ